MPPAHKVALIGSLLSLAPGTWNPAWLRGDSVRAALGDRARIAVDPRAVLGKMPAARMSEIKQRFLVPGLANCGLTAMLDLPTYRDVEDFAQFGDDYAASRLFQWLQRSAAAGEPVNARGIVCDTEAKMLDYYRTYLDLFRSLHREGYHYSGPDEICFGIAADGAIVHMRRGTHRLVSAHFLGLPLVTGYVTHADPDWVAACRIKWRTGPIEAIAAGIGELNAAAPSAKSA
ncbi:MAG TPA: hypothetical protein VG742_08625 [Dongiaceae bacterium]|nr:hypothetical protein [Dongiaceae bacterium]